MSTVGYETLVGWRYLFRRRKQPRILYGGLLLLTVSLALLLIGYQLEGTDGRTVSIFGALTLGRGLMAAGAGLFSLSVAVVLFGLLNRSMTLFSAFSTFMVAIGVAEVILVLAIMNGLHEDLGEKIVATKAHIVVEATKTSDTFSNYLTLKKNIESVPGVLGATPIFQTEIMLMSMINRVPTKMVGVDWRLLSASSDIPQQIEDGCLSAIGERGRKCRPLFLDLAAPNDPTRLSTRKSTVRDRDQEDISDELMAFPQPKSPQVQALPNLVIGSEMRKNLAVTLNENITALSPFGELGPTGPIPKKESFKVMGTFSSGMLEFDSHLVYANLAEVQNFVGVDDVANQIQVRVSDIEQSDEIARQIQTTIGPQFKVLDWRQRDKRLFSALQLEKIAMFIVLGINIILAAFSIISTLVMTILERRKEVAIFAAMGASRSSIFRIFVTQGAYVGLLGATMGATIGGGLSFALKKLGLPLNQEVYYISAVPVSIGASDVILIVGLALLMSIVSTLYPARLATQINPVEGLEA